MSAEGADEDWIDAPIFVTGLMKTGSTLLLALLDGHPDLLVYPDEPSFERLFGREYEDADALVRDFLFGTPNPLHFNRFVQEPLLAPAGFSPLDWRPVPSLPALGRLDLEQLAAQIELRGVEPGAHQFDAHAYHRVLARELSALGSPDRRAAVVGTARALAAGAERARPPRRWLFKQPLPEYRDASFEWFFGAFPRGSAVVLVRDPRAYVTSLLDYTAREAGGRWGALARTSYLLRRLATLEEDYRAFAAAPAKFGADRVVVLRYEDLISQTVPVMRGLMSFLDLRFDPALLTPTKVGARVSVPTATQASADRIYADSVSRFRRDLGRVRVAMVDAAVHGALGGEACPYPREIPAALAGVIHGPLRGVGALAARVRPMRRKGAPR